MSGHTCTSRTAAQHLPANNSQPLTLPLLPKCHEQAAFVQAAHVAAAVQRRVPHTGPAVLGCIVHPHRARQPAIKVLATHNKCSVCKSQMGKKETEVSSNPEARCPSSR